MMIKVMKEALIVVITAWQEKSKASPVQYRHQPPKQLIRKKEKKDEGKDKLKPPLRSGLGPPALTTPLLMTMGPTTRPSPAKHDVMTSPEGAPLLKDPKIDKRTGVPKTSEAEKAQIRELLAGREKGKTAEAEEAEETEEEETGKKTPPRRTSRDLE